MLTCNLDEELIKYGWEEDLWFHADNLSSAHIYVRLPEGQDWETIDENLLIDCAQLTKANSIEGMYVVAFRDFAGSQVLRTKRTWMVG
jgi:hypothetical protein